MGQGDVALGLGSAGAGVDGNGGPQGGTSPVRRPGSHVLVGGLLGCDFLEEINPGNTVKGTLVFDMPKGTEPASIELHDSPFSDGITVQLR